MQWNVAPTMESECPARPPPQTRAEHAKIKAVPEKGKTKSARLKVAKSGHPLTPAGRPFHSLVVRYDHDLCIHSRLNDGSMRRVPGPLKL